MLKKWIVPLLLAAFTTTMTDAQTSFDVPGVIVNHSPASSGRYIGSPSICVLPDGSYLASHDFFGKNSNERVAGEVKIFKSRDKGLTWQPIAEITGQYWSKLFVHGRNTYILGTTKEYGDLVIRRSVDGGHHWTEPTDSLHGLLRRGRFHCAPTPVIEYKGRLWRAVEDAMGVVPGWGKMFEAFVMSISTNADLLDAANWRYTNALPYDSTYLEGKFGGWLEGNAVVLPDGGIRNLLRVHYQHKGEEKAAITNISPDGTTATFDGFIDFPGGAKKFNIRYDATTQLFWTLSNYVPAEYESDNQERVRNTLALCSSPDLRQWKVNHIVLQRANAAKHGFQYADWQFDGKDIIAVVRTAYDDAEGGADNQHNANYLTFQRVADFRQWK